MTNFTHISAGPEPGAARGLLSAVSRQSSDLGSDRQMTERVYNVLFLCTGNSARSILAESLLNHWGGGKFRGFSAGSFPKGQVHPRAIELLQRMNLPAVGFRSKSWDEFAASRAPPIDFIFTVCDNAAGEVCPVWPGKPMTAHWGIADPAAVEGTEADKAFAFRKALKELETRIKLFKNLPIDSLDRMTLQSRLREIGRSSTAAEPG
jgi:arsenate reductase